MVTSKVPGVPEAVMVPSLVVPSSHAIVATKSEAEALALLESLKCDTVPVKGVPSVALTTAAEELTVPHPTLVAAESVEVNVPSVSFMVTAIVPPPAWSNVCDPLTIKPP